MKNSHIVFKKNVALAPLSTFRVGGRAEYFYEAHTVPQLLQAISSAKAQKLPFRIFAGGSNVVFPDGLVSGAVIRFFGGRIEACGARDLCVDAGVPLVRVVARAVSLGFQGLETLAGIPGTIGGAVVGNAGAYGKSISGVVRRVEIFDGKRRLWLSDEACYFRYRDSVFKHRPLLVLRVRCRFRSGNAKELRRVTRDIIAKRGSKYPAGLRCPGSFFKNVLVVGLPRRVVRKLNQSKIIDGKIPAGYLLEEAGVKGERYRRLSVADYHGNLIVNRGGATSRDVRHFANRLRDKVYRRFGIRLEEEVRYF